MAYTGPEIHADYGYALPIRVEADTSLDFTDDALSPIVFRVGTPAASLESGPLIEVTLAASSKRVAFGQVDASALRLTPGEYGYAVSVATGEGRSLIVHGRFRVVPSVLGP